MADLPSDSMGPTIIFDLGQVLSDHTGKEAATAALLGVPVEHLIEPYWRHRLAFDQGCSSLDYWAPIGRALGIEIDEPFAERLSVADADAWVAIRPTARQLLVDLSTAGRSVAILSNAPIDMYEAIDRAEWRRWVGSVFISGVLQVAKPDPEIYRHVAQTLDRDPATLHFIDDRADNVEAARAQGWQAHLWVDDDDSRAWLRSVGAL